MSQTIVRYFWQLCLRFFLKIFFRLKIIGKENLKTDNPCVLIANHASHLDALSLSTVLPINKVDRVFSMAAKDYFFASFFRSLLSVFLINAMPFDRKKEKRKSLELCADLLNLSDHVLIMFPEGTRSTTGEIQSFKKGIGILTANTNRLIIPCYIHNAYQAWPKGTALPKPKKLTIRIGRPIDCQSIPATDEGYLQIAELSEQAVKKLRELHV